MIRLAPITVLLTLSACAVSPTLPRDPNPQTTRTAQADTAIQRQDDCLQKAARNSSDPVAVAAACEKQTRAAAEAAGRGLDPAAQQALAARYEAQKVGEAAKAIGEVERRRDRRANDSDKPQIPYSRFAEAK